MTGRRGLGRREVLAGIAGVAGVGAAAAIGCAKAPAVTRSKTSSPQLLDGVMAGDVGEDWALVWGRSDRPAQMVVEWTAGSRSGRVVGPVVGDASGFTGTTRLVDLPPGADVDYRVTFEEVHGRGASAPATGRLRTAPSEARDLEILWGGDTCGQGFGVGEPAEPGVDEVGVIGLKTYASMAEHDADLMIHCGDLVYADSPIPRAMLLPDGTLWRNRTAPHRDKVAETLEEFRAAYRYNFLDDSFARFHRQVATIFAWDDHEVLNNWYPGEVLPAEDRRYTERSVDVLAARARQAFREHTAIAGPSIHRVIRYGPLLDVFVVDMRSFRGPNGPGLEDTKGPATAFLGSAQASWLAASLAGSRALWKLVVADMPLGLTIPDGDAAIEALANGDPGPPRGRELELAGLLAQLRAGGVRNLVFVTADVHYTAAHRYDPARAIFSDFDPFWEFVSGPLHAGTFGPNELDPTFGPELRFIKAPPPGEGNLPPSAGYQFFGQIQIAASGLMTVTLRDREDAALWSIDLPANERV
ncbi:MAG: alkaline phosphatase D family protein [Myxococcales bacterium]|nr:alkaline phosphatase D family protein [Myxococcales bacterium]